MLQRWFRLALLFGSGVLVGALVLSIFVYRGLRQVPDFYEQALSAEPELQFLQGDELERRVLELHNDVTQGGRWEALFTADEINGWLAADLPAKFPNSLPKDVEQPRVRITADGLLVACKHKAGKYTTVISVEVDLQLTEEPNVLAIRVRKARAGLIPLPLKQYLGRISLFAQRARIPLRWQQSGDDPVALLTIPSQHEDYVRQEIRVERLELRQGALYLAGSSQDPDSPGGPTIQAARAMETLHSL